MLDQHVVQVDPNRPHEEQARHHRERDDVSAFCDWRGFGHFAFCELSYVRARSRCTYPPSTNKCCPVVWLDFVERRNTTIEAISSDVVIRFSRGIFDRMMSSFSSGFGNVSSQLR